MGKSKVLLDESLDISEKFRVELKVFEVEASDRYPEGIKVRFVLIDRVEKVPRLLVDNHVPFGFHVHEELPHNKESRRTLNVQNYFDALGEFKRLTKEIIKNEN